MDGSINFLMLLTLYDFLFSISFVVKYIDPYSIYILLLHDDDNFIIINSWSPSDYTLLGFLSSIKIMSLIWMHPFGSLKVFPFI